MSEQHTDGATILIVDDEQGPREALRIILRPFYEIYLAEHADEALHIIREHPIDLVTIDLNLPHIQGTELLQRIKQEREDIETIIISAYHHLASAMIGLHYGVAGYLFKPFNVVELLNLINHAITKKRQIDRLRQFLNKGYELWTTTNNLSDVWNIVDSLYNAHTDNPTRFHVGMPAHPSNMAQLMDLLLAKGGEFYRHACRVSAYASFFGQRLNLPKAERRAIEIGAFLHDLGMLAIPEAPLCLHCSTESPLTDDSRRHPQIGGRMVTPLNLPQNIVQIVTYHHERFDGAGYPFGLQGDQIPRLAYIVSLADRFDQLRARSATQNNQQAIDDLHALAGTHFDPNLTKQFVAAMTESQASLPVITPQPVQIDHQAT